MPVLPKWDVSLFSRGLYRDSMKNVPLTEDRIRSGHVLYYREGRNAPVAVMGVLGDGNREKDYDWFYFANPTLDTNSALTVVGTVRARPHQRLDLRAAYKRGFTGSKVERLPSYWASKRIDDAFVASAKLQAHPWVSIFAEYARYVWGPAETSAEMLGIRPTTLASRIKTLGLSPRPRGS